MPKETKFDRRVDNLKMVFLEYFFEEFKEGPDGYESMRRIYEEWMMKYEADLHKSIFIGYPKKIDLIECVIDA